MMLGVCSLLFLALPPVLAAQDVGSNAGSPADESGFELQQNYPNPFRTTTRIPFELHSVLFEDGPVEVTMRIFNVLQQFVAYPTAMNYPGGSGSEIEGLVYNTPGRQEAFWDGRDRNGRQVASGLYYLQVTVKGQRRIMTMILNR
jgi:hypothetical protein